MLEGFGSILDDEEVITGNLVRERIEEWIEENCEIVGDYKIFQEQDEYYVDVDGSVEITNHYIKKFPIELFRFNKVSCYFSCDDCVELTSLEGCPKEVYGDFYCYKCKSLINLVGAPVEVGGAFDCSFCTGLRTMVGLPKKIYEDLIYNGCNRNLYNDKEENRIRELNICGEIIKY